MDDATGLAICGGVGEEESTYCNEMLGVRVLESSAGRVRFYRGDQDLGWASDVLSEHELVLLPLVRTSFGCDATIVECAIFKWPSQDGYVWVNVSDLWARLHLQCSLGSGAAWFQRKAPTWQGFANRYGLASTAVRHGVAYVDDGQDVHDSRTLCFSSVHLSMLLIVATRSAFAESSRRSETAANLQARGAFRRLALGVLSYIKEDTDFDVVLGPMPARAGGLFVGATHAVVALRSGAVSCEALAGALADSAGGTACVDAEIVEIRAMEGKSFEDFFVAVYNMSARRNAVVSVPLFAQLLRQTTQCVERKLTSRSEVFTCVGRRRVLEREYSDVPAAAVVQASVYDASNPRKTDRELARYANAVSRACEGAQCLAVAGPDGTKVGTDLIISMAVVMNPDNCKVGLLFPQVSPIGSNPSSSSSVLSNVINMLYYSCPPRTSITVSVQCIA